MFLFSVLLEMFVQSLTLIIQAIFVLELVKYSPPRNLFLVNLPYHKNSNIKFPLNTSYDQISICQISFDIHLLMQKSKYLNSISMFFFVNCIFLLKWSKQEISNKTVYTIHSFPHIFWSFSEHYHKRKTMWWNIAILHPWSKAGKSYIQIY